MVYLLFLSVSSITVVITLIIMVKNETELWEEYHKVVIYIDLVGRVFTYGPGDKGSIPGQVIPKTQKMVLDTTLLNTISYVSRVK